MKAIPEQGLKGTIGMLDGLRGLAILLVVAYHYTSSIWFGWVGVDLFFVLSGFLITCKLLESAGSKKYFTIFYLKRLLRIAPLYYLVLALFFWLLPTVLPAFITSSYHALQDLQRYYWTFSSNFYVAKHGWPDNITLVPYWSLACEMQFYLIWPVVVLLAVRLPKRGQVLLLFGCILLAIGFRFIGNAFGQLSILFRYVLMPARLDAFACGALIAVCLMNNWYTSLLKKAWWLMLLSLLLITAICWLSNQRWALASAAAGKLGYTLNAIFWSGFFLTAWFGKQGVLSNALLMDWLRKTGKYSYGIYIFHVPIKVMLEKASTSYTWLRLPFNSLFLAGLLLSFGCAFLSYHLFEKHFLQMKSTLDKQLSVG